MEIQEILNGKYKIYRIENTGYTKLKKNQKYKMENTRNTKWKTYWI